MTWWSRRKARAEGLEVTEELKKQSLQKEHAARGLSGQALDIQVRKNRVRWLKNYLTEEGTRRAKELGWPNTYTFTKSLAESLIAKHGAGLPIAIVGRPAICRDLGRRPFSRRGMKGSILRRRCRICWGRRSGNCLRTNASGSDIIPVDAVCAGMTLIGAALVERRRRSDVPVATWRSRILRHGAGRLS